MKFIPLNDIIDLREKALVITALIKLVVRIDCPRCLQVTKHNLVGADSHDCSINLKEPIDSLALLEANNL
jgi:hypothetical protein